MAINVPIAVLISFALFKSAGNGTLHAAGRARSMCVSPGFHLFPPVDTLK